MHVLRNVAACLQQSPFLLLMMDETTDFSNNEQTTIIVRWVSEHLEVHEEFLAVYHVPSIDAVTLTRVAKDALVRMNLSMSKLRGQCYDGASTTRGARSGVAKGILDEEPRAVYTHCYGHSINLAASDAVKQTKLMKDTLDTTHEITKLIKYPPRREAVFQELKQGSKISAGSHTAGILVLCPTRWTVRANSLASIVHNYDLLQRTWEEVFEVARDTETKARINGVAAQMKAFDFLLAPFLVRCYYAAQITSAKHYRRKRSLLPKVNRWGEWSLTHCVPSEPRNRTTYSGKKRLQLQSLLIFGEPQVPRQRKMPKRYDDSLANGTFHDTPKVYYHRLYYEAIDNIANGLKDRFEQPGYKVYCNLEQLWTKACQGKDFEEEFQIICSFHKDDLHLRCQF